MLLTYTYSPKMKKSLSAPNLTSLSAQPSTKIRRVSISALGLAGDTTSPIGVPWHEIEYVATKVPINKVVACAAPSIVETQDFQDLGACLSEPHDVSQEETSHTPSRRYAWLQRSLEDEAVCQRYQSLLGRLRRRAK